MMSSSAPMISVPHPVSSRGSDTYPSAQTTAENVPLTFSSQNDNAISAGNGISDVQLSVSSGTLTLSTTSGLTFTNGTSNGGNSLDFKGSTSAMNAALNGLVFTPVTNFTGSDPLTFITGKTILGLLNFNTAQTIAMTVTASGPTVAMAASANPNPVTGTAAALSVLGADSAGASDLSYTWATTGTPPAPVGFSPNGNHGARNTTATFSQPGLYHFQVTITNAAGLSTTSSVSVTVGQILNSIVVSPASSALQENQTQQFTATGYDGFGDVIASPPNFTWSKAAGVGSINSGGLYSAPGATGSASITASSGIVSGSASITVTNAAPTVATAASAGPATVTGTTTALSVWGADDGGEGNLTYSWSMLSKPAGAAVPSFSLNGTHGSKNTTATFSQAGTYVLQATITDAGGLTATSSVSVSVDQTLTATAVSPSNTSLAAGATRQFSAIALDQFNMSMNVQPSFHWTATDGVIDSTGFYTAPSTAGPATVSAATGGLSTSTSVRIVGSNSAIVSPSIVTGRSTTLSVVGGATRGVTYTWSTLTDPSGAATPTFSANASSAAQTTTATFFNSGNYTFQVAINGGTTTTLTVAVSVNQTLSDIEVAPGTGSLEENGRKAFSAVGFDQFGRAMLVQPNVAWSVASGGGTIDGSGLYTAAGSGGAGAATIAASSGSIAGSANITAINAAPTIAAMPAAAPPTVYGTTTQLSVQGADDGGESNLTYTWSVIGNPPAPIGFSSNASNAAKITTVTFAKAGLYRFLVTVTDAEGLSITSNLSVIVNQTVTRLALSPASVTVMEGQSQQFSETATDQFGDPMTPPALMWSVRSGTGFIDSDGMYTAAATSGTTIVSAIADGVMATATITVPDEAPAVAISAAAAPDQVTATSTRLSVLGSDDNGEANLIYTWAAVGTSPAPVAFSANATYAAKNTTARFTQAGHYQFIVTVTDANGLTASSSVNVTVAQTLSSLAVSPPSPITREGSTQQFLVAAADQFGNGMSAPTLAWSVSRGGGTVDNSGLYTASVAPGIATISASSASVSGNATVTIPNQPPTVAMAAAATPTPITGSSAALSVLGADDGGESNLTYTWSTIGSPPAPVSFSVNGTNGAKDSTARFSATGSYDLMVTITDAEGATASSTVHLIVSPVLASVGVTPANPSLGRAESVQFSAATYDQFGALLANQPTFSWSTVGSVGSIDASGLYTAPAAGNGTDTVIATTGNLSGTASVELIDELSASVPASVNAAPGVPLAFVGEDAISIADANPATGSVPVSITVVARHGTINLSETAGLSFQNGTTSHGDQTIFSGSISDVDKALRGLNYTSDAGFTGTGSVALTINEVGNGKASPSYPIAIEVISSAISLSGGNSGTISGTTSNTDQNLNSVLNTDSTQTTVSPLTYTGTVVVDTTIFGDAVISGGTSAPSNSVTHTTQTPTATPTPAKQKQNDAAPKPAAEATNAPANNVPPRGSMLPAANVAVPDIRVQSVPEHVFAFLAARSEMSRELDAADDKLVADHKLKVVAGSATVASVGASAAYVLWMLRGGSLLSSLLSILPAWQSIDPLPVLDNFESRKRRKNRVKSDDESLESMVDKSNGEAERADVEEEESARHETARHETAGHETAGKEAADLGSQGKS